MLDLIIEEHLLPLAKHKHYSYTKHKRPQLELSDKNKTCTVIVSNMITFDSAPIHSKVIMCKYTDTRLAYTHPCYFDLVDPDSIDQIIRHFKFLIKRL